MRFALVAALPGLVAAPLLSACVGLDCSEEVRPSVNITVVDEMETAQKDAQVRFSIDGRAEEDAECVGGTSDAGASCESWIAAYEQSGSFTIKASSADGMKQAQTTVMVRADECHVLTQTVTLTLQ